MHFLASVFTGAALTAGSFLGFLHGGPATSTRPIEDNRPFATSTIADTRSHLGNVATSTIVCVGAAVSVREQSIDTAEAALTSVLNSAYSNRAGALASAYALTTGGDAVGVAVRAAWQGFASSTKSAQNAWKRRRTAAWQTFMTSAQACKAPPSILDTNDSSLETLGQ
jgi:hypothetical protein